MVVEHNDLIRDLKYWETLTVSSMMLRPVSQFKEIISIDKCYI